jgi:hypothetical protein
MEKGKEEEEKSDIVECYPQVLRNQYVKESGDKRGLGALTIDLTRSHNRKGSIVAAQGV